VERAPSDSEPGYGQPFLADGGGEQRRREPRASRPRGWPARLLPWCLAAPLLLAAGLGFLQDDWNGLAYFDASGFKAVVEQLVAPGPQFQRPLAYLVFYLERGLFGAWAPGWHLVHLALFAGAAALTGRLARALGGERAAPWAVAFALIYAGRVEAYSWIAAIPDLLALLLVLAALDLALAAGRRDSPSPLAGAGLFALAGLAPLAKEAAWCLPVVLIGWNAMGVPPGARPRGRRWALAAVLAGSGAAAIFRLATVGGIGGYAGTSLAAAVARAPRLLPLFAEQVLVPVEISGSPLSIVLGAFTAAAFLAAVAGALPGWRRAPAGALGVRVGGVRVGGAGGAGGGNGPGGGGGAGDGSSLVRAGFVLGVAGLLPVLPYLTPHVLHEQSRYFAIPGAGAALLAAGLIGRGGWRRTRGGALIAAWTLATVANLQPWLDAARLRDRTLAAIGAATAAPGRHTVWVRGPIGERPGGAKVLGGALASAVRLTFPERSISADSEVFQRYLGKPPEPHAEPGTIVHVITVGDRPPARPKGSPRRHGRDIPAL
jgi:hypothetical protein